MDKYMEPIRIAQIMGKWVGGGVESVVMNYYRFINHNSVQFDFICDADSIHIPYDEIQSYGGRVIIISPYQKLFTYEKELKKILISNNYKIIHSHINTLSIFPLFVAKLAGTKVRIAHSHSTTNKKEVKKNLMKSILRPYARVFSTDFFCCSELAGRYLFGDKAYDTGRVQLINNAIDLDQFIYNENVRATKRKELHIDNDTVVIGHIGRFVKQKNHHFLIHIFRELHSLHKNTLLLLAGQGPLEEEIKDIVNAYDLTDYVRFLGQRNDANVLYQVFDVFLLPSLYEGLPVVGVEAQAAGLLCFLSDDMTTETKVLETTQFISLQKSPKEWAHMILDSMKVFNRRNAGEEITANGFRIQDEAADLEKYYEALWNSEERLRG